MPEDPHPVKPGTCGTVQLVDDIGTLHCKFDDGRMLGVIWGEIRTAAPGGAAVLLSIF